MFRVPRCNARLLALTVLLGTWAVPAEARIGTMPHRLVVLTNQRYNHDCFWGGPRGSGYGELPGAQEIQKANLYPDVGATYFAGQFHLPEGASLTLAGRFPHSRYMSYAIQTALKGGSLGGGDRLHDDEIVPAPGSTNPFVAGHRRDASARSYTVQVVGGPVPEKRATNVIYTGSTDPNAQVTLVLRNYIPDRGRDGTGDAGLPTLTLHLADGRSLEGAPACEALDVSKKQAPVEFPVKLWKDLVAGAADPATAPAAREPYWERFWNVAYSVIGSFLADKSQREQKYPPVDDGGFGGNPDTRYLITAASRRFGKVFTIHARMPRIPRTFPAAARMPAGDLRYWSVCAGSAPTSGLGYDCVFDQQVALREGLYTIVVSKPADRPRNARLACGYTWLNAGDGEMNPDGTGRKDMTFFYMRFMAPDPSWVHAPQRMTKPGTEAKVMGSYLPRSSYTSKRNFEKRGCDRPTTHRDRSIQAG